MSYQHLNAANANIAPTRKYMKVKINGCIVICGIPMALAHINVFVFSIEVFNLS